MPLSINLVDIDSTTKSSILTSTQDRDTSVKDTFYTLSYKVLNMSIYSNIDLLVLKFWPIRIFQLVDKILEGKVPILSLQVTQAITKPLTEKDLVKL